MAPAEKSGEGSRKIWPPGGLAAGDLSQDLCFQPLLSWAPPLIAPRLPKIWTGPFKKRPRCRLTSATCLVGKNAAKAKKKLATGV